MSISLLELLISQVWQVTILAVVVKWLTNSALKNHPYWSYQLWLLVMIKSITPPVLASHCGVFSWCFHRLSAQTNWFFQQGLGHTIESNTLARGLAMFWGISASIALCLVLLKWLRIQHQIKTGATAVPPKLSALMNRLTDDLGIQRKVKLVLTNEPAGPMVIGVAAPMIVIPKSLLDENSIAKLEPILVHELLHVRRGDTWVALLETFVRCVWWFHPEMRRAADATSQTAELCCDQEVISELDCKPRFYADCLLGVIESRCQLQPLVGQPSIRGDQVTQNRLVRIMTVRKAPPVVLWRLAVALLLLLVVLPGRPI